MPLLLSDRATTAAPVPLVTVGEARAFGIRIRTTAFVRIRPGIYADRTAYEALKPWERYAVRVHAFVRAHPDAALCLESAAVVHGLPLFGETRDIHVHSPERPRSRRFGDVAVHTSEDERVLERRGGVLVTSLLDTVADLGRALPPARALAVFDAALSPAQGGPLSLGRLRGLGASRVSSRGSARQRWLWEHADDRAESPAESVSRAVIEWSGFPRPELQRVFHYEGAEDRVDFHFPGSRVIGEADGWGKYGFEDPDAAAERLIEEKRREDRLRRHGHPFGRWDLADAWRVTPLQRALTTAGVAYARPADPVMLHTLQDRRRDAPRRSPGAFAARETRS
ncbi:hypothetical protein [Microbacterium capsulatum]|uniref:Transcriptional regulator, AbiEi antitoxin, Type IV TA system n=1 Tax=Microbacterium capsulatum TaxID=3041921 RepID=A0ABU0XJ92_9MICO|nr:hypothetical protein [Microbacterium sp. ASV81]MDQ4214215.1 hypothetical protein [Microbacterium sp. ASV81]